jgi:hypothetical protein
MPNISINQPADPVHNPFNAQGIARSNDTQVSGILYQFNNNGDITAKYPNQPIVVNTTPPNFTIQFQGAPPGYWVLLVRGMQSNASGAETFHVT